MASAIGSTQKSDRCNYMECLLPEWGEGHQLSDSAVLVNFGNSIGRHILKILRYPARPAHFYFAHHGICTQAEVQAGIVARVVTSAAVHFIDLGHGWRVDRNPC